MLNLYGVKKHIQKECAFIRLTQALFISTNIKTSLNYRLSLFPIFDSLAKVLPSSKASI